MIFALPVLLLLATAFPAHSEPPEMPSSTPSDARTWRNLLSQAEGLGLPTLFLKNMPPDFVRMEFDDLHDFAAEYHPAEHRMILNRSLSFNAAGSALRPLNQLTHKQLETLYHELFHAYMDFLAAPEEPQRAQSNRVVMAFAREQQQCRYQHVLITPMVQRKTQTEERFLSETESWELLNETWAVFIGWAAWTHLEVGDGKKAGDLKRQNVIQEWLRRLKKADLEADLRGYYEPEDPRERVLVRKRFLAPEFRISAQEVGMLLEKVLAEPSQVVRLSGEILERNRRALKYGKVCAAREDMP